VTAVVAGISISLHVRTSSTATVLTYRITR